jgi:hypothetical protein
LPRKINEAKPIEDPLIFLLDRLAISSVSFANQMLCGFEFASILPELLLYRLES